MKNADVEIIAKVESALMSLQRFQWEQGCAAQAILEYEGFGDKVAQLCKSTMLRFAKDGRIGIMEKNEAVNDTAAIGEALLVSAEKTGDTSFKKAADKLYFYFKHRAPKSIDGVIYHFNIKNEFWVDAYYMTPPFFCKYGDFDEAIKQIKGMRQYLYHEDKKLLSHIWDDDIGDFGHKDFWGVGNGWAMAGITRVINMLPKDRADERMFLITYLNELIEGCVIWQRDDGLFHNILGDSESFVETNVGQMLAYSIYRGVTAGYVDKKYLINADMAREAAYGKVDEYGFVQGVCGAPDFEHSGVAPEGQAFFILMEAAARDYLNSLS
jgi:rhamnogalacturonyl hydrolase YesR